ncbi:MAG: LysM peptidoglycan-binding domain-containing protein [Cellulosilyticaceae bacterium]
MGKIIYEPKKLRDEVKVQQETHEVTVKKDEEKETRYNALIDSIDSVRPIGDTDCDYIMYLEDYAYTYMYQFATTDLSYEHAAMIVGEYYPETKENIICGIMPIPQNQFKNSDEWINKEAIESLFVEKEKYFPGTVTLGWMHMQPGYGTMLTMKEVKVQRDLFDREGSILLLVDPINKIETFYVYEDDTLKEQTGYYLYYDKNPSMQKYMLEHPFIPIEKEQQEDNVVNQFREMGRLRKREYQQKKKTNVAVLAACVGLIVVAGFLAKESSDNNPISKAQNQSVDKAKTSTNELADSSGQVNFIIEPVDKPEAGVKEPLVSAEDIIDATSNSVVAEKENKVDTDETKETNNNNESADNIVEEAKVETKEEVVTEEVASQESNKEVASNEIGEVKEEDTDYITYKVQNGDTLRKISQDHYKTELRAKDIIKLNGLENGDNIYPGQTLKLPVE